MSLAKCTSNWGSRIGLSSGTYPSLGFDVTGNNTNFRILYTSPASPLSTIASTNQSLPKASALAGETLMRELTMLKGGFLQSLLVKNVLLNGTEVAYDPYADTRTITSAAQAAEFLTTGPVQIASGTLDFQIQSSVQLRGNSVDSTSAVPISLLITDEQTGSVLLTRVLDSLGSKTPFVTTKSHSLPTAGLDGKTVRLTVAPVLTSNDNVRWAATIIHYDTSEVKKESVPQTTIQPASGPIPTEFRLEGAYPNPFNPATTIRFGLPSPSHVSLVVYDMLGREIAELMCGEMPAGLHSVTWMASTFASGIYLARLVVVDEFGKERINRVARLILAK